MNKRNDSAIYRAYQEAKKDPKKFVKDVPPAFGISRSELYNVVRRVEKGDGIRIRLVSEAARRAALWKYKYEARFRAIPKDRTALAVTMLRRLIKDMNEDGFKVLHIAKRIRKDHTTVIHHLKS